MIEECECQHCTDQRNGIFKPLIALTFEEERDWLAGKRPDIEKLIIAKRAEFFERLRMAHTKPGCIRYTEWGVCDRRNKIREK